MDSTFGYSACIKHIELWDRTLQRDHYYNAADSLVACPQSGQFVNVLPGSDLHFRAGETVRLLPGFHAQAGSRVHAYIQSCTPQTSKPCNFTLSKDSVALTTWGIVTEAAPAPTPAPELRIYPQPARDWVALDPHVLAAFISPSGQGLKVLVPVSTPPSGHNHTFEALCRYAQAHWQLQADTTGRDLPRLCFLSHDPHCCFQPHAQAFCPTIDTLATEPQLKPEANLPATFTKPGKNLPETSTKPRKNLPETFTEPGTNLPETSIKPEAKLPATFTKPGKNLPETSIKPGTNLPETFAEPGTNQPATFNEPGVIQPETFTKPGTAASPVAAGESPEALLQRVSACVAQLEAAGLDITQGYERWL